ncbi:hypothetical protein [Phycicoccus duodecadis]|uniref:Uncharacterized protein n=1 Tax=Phycicoccus duodecadis TaxID=173053 RepID=A0A2N3YFH8_9MICO|nr:hypothetical protein [Phycicoccus duodecadis]PKW25593.1 hypothetical protein ATL31_0390 [Phycicoccus duodecadis]
MTSQRWPEDVGSVGDEAARLLESLRRAGLEAAAHVSEPAPAARTRTGGATPGAAPEAPDGAHHPADDAKADGPKAFSCDDPVCQWCPVCRASAFVRRLSPETLSGLAELAGVAAAVLSDLAGARARQEGAGPGADHARTPAAEEEPRG